jgi:membrane protease YdiL (CAAX protease family)
MRALAPQHDIEEYPAPDREPVAEISLRGVTALELISVMASVIITIWGIIPLQPRQRWLLAMPALLAIALMINSQRVRGESAREIGLGFDYFSRALWLVMGPTLIACLVFAAIGYFTGSFHRTSHFWLNALATPLWALVQQYVLQGFIYRRVRFLLVNDSQSSAERKRRLKLAILATAAIFSCAHAPNPMLMTLTFTGGVIWSWVYQRAPNLLALAMSHALISLMLMTSLPPWLLPSMSVGYKHFLYQKF